MKRSEIRNGQHVTYKFGDSTKNGDYIIDEAVKPMDKFVDGRVSIGYVRSHPDRFSFTDNAEQPYSPIKGYDSTADTLTHIRKVNLFLTRMASELLQRGAIHDQSKLEEPEKSVLDIAPVLKDMEYESVAYKKRREVLKPAIEHHHSVNRHHPEFHDDGVNDMTLIDIVEMYCDWKAATLRTPSGDILKALEINKTVFGIDEQLYGIFLNTYEQERHKYDTQNQEL